MMTRSRIGVLCLVLLLVPLASHAQDADKRRVAQLGKMTLDQVTTKDGFAYYSGHLPVEGNFPAMYAHTGNAITVLGRGFMREYPIHEWRKAVQAYRALLIMNGYELPTE
ncbi:MAG: hypothetical protein HY322_00485 [Betaproteobacteria bacterium]|nr:hypothetical protein [Betaproteobacteria bacterium]